MILKTYPFSYEKHVPTWQQFELTSILRFIDKTRYDDQPRTIYNKLFDDWQENIAGTDLRCIEVVKQDSKDEPKSVVLAA